MSRFGISGAPARLEDDRLLRGAGRFVADVAPTGALTAVFVRAEIGHARLRAVDIAAAMASPGVAAVFVAADVEAAGVEGLGSGQVSNRDGAPFARTRRPILASGRVRYDGEAIAMVLADGEAAAEAAARRVRLDLEPLETIVDTGAALDADAPQLHETAPGNLAFDWACGDEAAVDAALSGADAVVEIALVNNRVVSAPMETRGVVAMWDAATGQLTVESNGQSVWDLKNAIAAGLGLSRDRVRVLTGDVGGGFGTKAYPYPEHVAVGFAARALGRPVKWTATREEGCRSDSMGRDHVSRAWAGFDAERRVIALKVETIAALGAYLSPFAPFIPTGAASRVIPGVYAVQDVFYGVRGVYTNTAPVDAYRGAGRPESIYLLERLMDKAARTFGLDPIELRAKSYVPPSALPYVSAVGETYDSGAFEAAAREAARRADWSGFETRRRAAAARGALRGIGLCSYIEAVLGSPKETARIVLAEDGWTEVHVGTQSNGQGHETAYAQIVHERLGVAFDRIRVRQGDSDLLAHGGGTGGSRSVTTQGVAIGAAAAALIEGLTPFAAEALEAQDADTAFAEGGFRVAAANRFISLAALADRARAAGRAELTSAERKTTLPGRSFPNGCHIAEVEVDPDTGVVHVARYTVVDDFGVLVNPALALGQVQGGVAQGFGQAMKERVVYDAATGRLATRTLQSYAIPRASDAPAIRFRHQGVASTANPLGVKGCGEAGTVGALAALANATLDALWPLGVRDLDMPLTPERVWRAIAAARADQGEKA